jgi:hypothetical protein
MPVWNVEVIAPATPLLRMTSVERLRYFAKEKSMETAGWKADDYRQRSRSAATQEESYKMLTRSYEWEDRFSERRAALFAYCKEIDAKYAT